MKKIIQVRGSKGGVGKSIVAMAVIHVLLGRDEKILLLETDDANPDVAKVYGKTVQTIALSLSDAEGWAELANAVEIHRDQTVVINSRAADQESVSAYNERFWRAATLLKRRIITLWVISADYDPVLQLHDYLELVPADAPHLIHVVKNLYHSPSGSFPTYDKSKSKKRIEEGGGKTIAFPVMVQRNQSRLYNERHTIEEILNHGPIGDRVEMECWVEEVIHSLGGILDG